VAVRVFLGTVLGLFFFTLQSIVAYFFALMGWSLFLAVLLPNLILVGLIALSVVWIGRR
jgi:lipopolysaccharide export LptBFGC system permease protein LptF